MFYYLKASWIWMRRWSHCRGFGVQSPSAYRFIRYVINEHYPYYAYDALKERMNKLSKHEQKLGRLFFRLANFWQPVCCYCDDSSLMEYAQAGARNMKQFSVSDFMSQYLRCSDASCIPDDSRLLVWIDSDVYGNEMEEILKNCHSQTLLVVNNIRRKNHRLWKEIQENELVGITFHLYYCGIVFFDKSVYKQHYEVNF